MTPSDLNSDPRVPAPIEPEPAPASEVVPPSPAAPPVAEEKVEGPSPKDPAKDTTKKDKEKDKDRYRERERDKDTEKERDRDKDKSKKKKKKEKEETRKADPWQRYKALLDTLKESQDLVEQGKKQVQYEQKQAMEQLRRQVADLAIKAAEHLIARSLDDRTQRELVDEYVRDLAAMEPRDTRT